MIFAVLGEVIGTGIIGAIVSYPVMAFLMGRSGLSWMFYVPGFICATLIGGSIAFLFLRYLQKAKLLVKFQESLGSKVVEQRENPAAESLGIAAIGIMVCLMVYVLLRNFFHVEGALSIGIPAAAFLFVEAMAILYFTHSEKAKTNLRDVV